MHSAHTQMHIPKRVSFLRILRAGSLVLALPGWTLGKMKSSGISEPDSAHPAGALWACCLAECGQRESCIPDLTPSRLPITLRIQSTHRPSLSHLSLASRMVSGCLCGLARWHCSHGPRIRPSAAPDALPLPPSHLVTSSSFSVSAELSLPQGGTPRTEHPLSPCCLPPLCTAW